MKHLLVLMAVGIALPAIECHWSNKDISDKLVVIQRECLKENPVADDIKAKLANRELIEDETFKKYVACLGKGAGFMNPDGTLNSATIKATQAIVVNSNKYDKIIDDCTGHSVVNDPVSSVWNYVRCIQAEGTGQNFDDMIQFYMHF